MRRNLTPESRGLQGTLYYTGDEGGRVEGSEGFGDFAEDCWEGVGVVDHVFAFTVEAGGGKGG